MKHFIGLFFSILLVVSCQKKIDVPADSGSINGDITENNNGVYVEPCHSTTFVTNYSVQPGKVPPFRFAKTQYPSGRIKTINMLSRANPIHAAFKPQAWEVIGTFTYDLTSVAYFVGTKTLWEYYKTSTGAAAKKQIAKKNIRLKFVFFTEESYAAPVGSVNYVINDYDKQDWALWLSPWFRELQVGQSSDEPSLLFSDNFEYTEDAMVLTAQSPDWNGTLTDYRLKKKLTFKYAPQPINPGNYRKHLYQPTQNWISMEYTLCEVMGWLPPQFNYAVQRTSVAVEFFTSPTNKVVQSQVYKNHKYDPGGKLLSYTYGDNVLQKTTWLCK